MGEVEVAAIFAGFAAAAAFVIVTIVQAGECIGHWWRRRHK